MRRSQRDGYPLENLRLTPLLGYCIVHIEESVSRMRNQHLIYLHPVASYATELTLMGSSVDGQRSIEVTPEKIGVVKSAARALDILELLIKLPRGLSLTEIGRDLDIPLSSLHNLMNTLILKGYINRDDATSVYQASSKLIQLAASYHAQHDLVGIADPVMKELGDLTGETTSLAILQDNVIVFIHKRSSQDLLQVVNPVGTRLPAHTTGLGKAMLACLPEEEVDRLYPHEQLEKLTPVTISGRAALKRALQEARQRGYAVDDRESHNGVWAVASAIRNRAGYPVAALSIAAPRSRVQGKDVSHWCEATASGAQKISQILGYV